MYFSKLRINILEIDYTSRKIYWLIIMLSLIVTLENYTHSWLKILFWIFWTLFVIALAEVYVKIISFMSKHKKRIPRWELNILLKEELSILFALDLPILLYILYSFKIINLVNFILLIKIWWIALLYFYWYKLWILLEKNIIRRFILWFISGLFWILIILLKSYFEI